MLFPVVFSVCVCVYLYICPCFYVLVSLLLPLSLYISSFAYRPFSLCNPTSLTDTHSFSYFSIYIGLQIIFLMLENMILMLFFFPLTTLSPVLSPHQVLDDEVRRRSKDVHSLTSRSQELEDRSGGKLGAISDVTALEQRYHALSSRVLALTAAVPDSPRASSESPAKESGIEDVFVARAHSSVAAAPPPSPPSSTPPPLSPRTTSLGPSPDEYLQALRRLQERAERLRAGMEKAEGGRGGRPLSAVVVEADETERQELAAKMKVGVGSCAMDIFKAPSLSFPSASLPKPFESMLFERIH